MKSRKKYNRKGKLNLKKFPVRYASVKSMVNAISDDKSFVRDFNAMIRLKRKEGSQKLHTDIIGHAIIIVGLCVLVCITIFSL